MFSRSKNTHYVVRPTILAIFLAFNLLQLGIFLVAQNSFNLASIKLHEISDEEMDEIEQVEKTITHLQSDFTVEKLTKDFHSAHLMRDRKIHFLAALVCGLLLMILGSISIFFFVKNWRISFHELRRLDPQVKIVFKVSFTSKVVGWCTTIVGSVIVITSALALRELIYYRDEAWFTAFMNYECMTHLASHYHSTLFLGIICLFWGVVATIFHWWKPHKQL
ncbi:hypothetical protein [Candidatus Uabimicrobium amorphum]|uniref:Uncharacterized protein n=1 Tax=Uabimicrobium amorphum TaxID=2596890 RepID=A0A5S9F241_UABAM|nr:hypothetical protein [Candidatus Uabimicrobium amorphum]BBM83078.1 hypothetical protein UABAM_01428 [Candidatus Uabimicrobium amorphum]